MNKIVPIDEEYLPEGSVMISEMDLNGIMTFANRKFCEVSAYELDELIGKNSSMIEHPGMPEIITTKMWQAIQDSQTWKGILKNMRKDGLYYWTEIEIMPIRDENDRVKGYMSARRAASRKNIQEAKELYNKMLEE